MGPNGLGGGGSGCAGSLWDLSLYSKTRIVSLNPCSDVRAGACDPRVLEFRTNPLATILGFPVRTRREFSARYYAKERVSEIREGKSAGNPSSDQNFGLVGSALVYHRQVLV